MRSLKRAALAAVALLAATFSVPAVEVGVTTGVDPEAQAQLATQVRTLEVGLNLSIGELISTGPNGLVQVIFRDASRLVVGPNSQVTIEQYLLRNEGLAENFTIDTLGGTFRFITGKSPKSSYNLKTPNGTIAVRGTAVDWSNILAGTFMVLYHGGIEPCSLMGDCMEIKGRCDFGLMNTAEVQMLHADDPPVDDHKRSTPYLISQLDIRYDFWVPQQLECLRATRGQEADDDDDDDDEDEDDDDECEGEGEGYCNSF